MTRIRWIACALLLNSWLALPSHAIELDYVKISDASPVSDIRHAGDGSGRMFFVTLFGTVLIHRDGTDLPTPFLDISGLVSTGGERGLLSLAFAPDYATSGIFYVYYTDNDGDSVLARYRVSDNPDVADPNSGEIVLSFAQPYPNHNGGRLVFGDDGYLYLSTGDGGSGGDPDNYAQRLDNLLGKVLRLDVDPSHGTYAIPPDNPFVNEPSALNEIWVYGLRNPWRIAFDSATGDLYIGDVGQQDTEEVNIVPAGSGGGQNFGWRVMEGNVCFRPLNCDRTGLELPVAQYPHSQGSCSITGGEVYRGSDYPSLDGLYFYGDYCSGIVWTLEINGEDRTIVQRSNTPFSIIAWGQDEDGEVYLSAAGGSIYRVVDIDVVEPEFVINPGLNDAWFNETTDGQGFFINVFPDVETMFVGWFTFDLELTPDEVPEDLGSAGHRWLTAIGGYDGDTATLDVFRTQGGFFDDPTVVDVSDAESYGTLTIVFQDCEFAVLEYDLFAVGVSGSMTIRRIVPDNIELCTLLAE